MKSEGLAFFTDVHWPLIGLVIFFLMFLVLTGLQLRGYDKRKMELLEKLPMEGD